MKVSIVVRSVASLLVLAVNASALAAQAPKPAGVAPEAREASEHSIPWKALDAYHTLLAASWHPAKERNDLAAFRTRAADLVVAARALTAEPVPAACGGPARANAVRALLEASEAAAKAATSSGLSDAQVKDALKVTHDRFHAVEEACTAPSGAAKR